MEYHLCMSLGCTVHPLACAQPMGHTKIGFTFARICGGMSCKWECYTRLNFVTVCNWPKPECRFTNNIFVTISGAVTSSSGEISEAVQTSTMLLFSEDLHKMESSTERSFPSVYFHVMEIMCAWGLTWFHHYIPRTKLLLRVHWLYYHFLL